MGTVLMAAMTIATIQIASQKTSVIMEITSPAVAKPLLSVQFFLLFMPAMLSPSATMLVIQNIYPNIMLTSETMKPAIASPFDRLLPVAEEYGCWEHQPTISTGPRTATSSRRS